ncbi:MAG TPA: caspase family protein [Chitinophagaceae bacterium]|nr:caspase family protein [Chitinophagaceae bacterium]
MSRVFSTLLFCFFSYSVFTQQPKLWLPIGHNTWLQYAQFSPDGRKVVTTSRDKTAKIWDANSGKLLYDLNGHLNWVFTAHFSPDGKKIVTASKDNTAIIWDAGNGVLLHVLKEHTGEVFSAWFSPDGKKIVTASADNTAKIWDAVTGKLLHTLKGHTDWVLSARFSFDGKKIVTASYDNTAKIWDTQSGSLYKNLIGHTGHINVAQFSNNGNKIITASDDSTGKIWDAVSGTLLFTLRAHTDSVVHGEFSPDDKIVVTASKDKTAKIWDAVTGELLHDLTGHKDWVYFAKFNPNGKQIVTASRDSLAKVWDAQTGEQLFDLVGHTDGVRFAQFSYDGKKIVTAGKDIMAKVWDSQTGKPLRELRGQSFWVDEAWFSPDGKKIFIGTWDDNEGRKDAKIWDAVSGKLLVRLVGHNHWVSSFRLSPDGKKIVTASYDNTAKIWDFATGKMLLDLIGHTQWVTSAEFSPNGKKIVTASWDSTIKIWDPIKGSLIKKIPFSNSINSAQFSPDGTRIVAAFEDKTAKVLDAETGSVLLTLEGHKEGVWFAKYSSGGDKIITTSKDNIAIVWDAIHGTKLLTLSNHQSRVTSAQFSPDEQRIVTTSEDKKAIVWNAKTGKPLHDLMDHTSSVSAAYFSPDGKKIATAGWDHTAKIWDVETGQLQFTFMPINDQDFLVMDTAYRFNGSEAARKYLYFTCGNEIVELEQVKDRLWEPTLAERIMNGDSIYAPKITDLNICGLTPEVKELDDNKDAFHFRILPRRGGLGETALYINGIEIQRYKKEQLKNNAGVYDLVIKKKELDSFFIKGQENPVTVKAWIADNTISSRGLIVKEDKTKENPVPPNLYAVLVGVSDYKGEELDLKYATKDATDISNALEAASRKLLDIDNKEHVFIYRLTTEKDHYLLPQKNSIKKTFEEISKKATANDILMIFFAGHGVMAGDEKKQFYFLGADASPLSATEATADVGISTAELTEWIKPANVKAQKKVLIFDACNSGQAIRDFVQLGKPEQGYVGTRGDDKAQQIRAIEKLNSQSGLIILAASESNKNAYELEQYGQGLLTYSLLSVIKLQPQILENGKYLDVSNWLNAAKKVASKISEENGKRQEPQLNTNNNFNIGVVDDEVRNKIILAAKKPLFARSNFQNADIKIDNLKIRSLIDKEMENISSGSNSPIFFSSLNESAEAFTLSGDYVIKGDSIVLSVLLIRGGAEVESKFEVKGTTADLSILVSNIVVNAIEFVSLPKQ